MAPGLHGFVFAGMDSGLFGTFFELTESAGARIFPESLIPEVNFEAGRWASGVLRELVASGAAPAAVAGWGEVPIRQTLATIEERIAECVTHAA